MNDVLGGSGFEVVELLHYSFIYSNIFNTPPYMNNVNCDCDTTSVDLQCSFSG